MNAKTKDRMPVIFIGHGSPMNSVEENEFTLSWKEIAKNIPKPKAIICISAHWTNDGTKVTMMANPKTIHDFYGFPKKLYDAKYPALGSPEIAKSIIDAVKTVKIKPDIDWGLDHGAWSVLINMYPKADIPVVQISLDESLPLEKHLKIGKELVRFRDEGVLIIGSGNLVHNLQAMDPAAKEYDWATSFDRFVKARLEEKDFNALTTYKKESSSRYALPTDEHYLPLLYALGASDGDEPKFYCEKIFYASVSMRCVVYGMGR